MTMTGEPSIPAYQPTPEEKIDLIEEVLGNPDEIFSYDDGACYLAAIEREDKWDVWSYCEESVSLCHEGTFDTYSEALCHARERVTEIQEEVADFLACVEDAKWAADEDLNAVLTPPFTFEDTTDFQHGFELEDAEAVYAFFRRHRGLLCPEEWGNLYFCTLTDRKGTRCWVTQSHRGEMRLES